VKTYALYVASTNNNNTMKIAEDDRRHFLLHARDTYVGPEPEKKKYFYELRAELESDESAQYFYHYLLQRKLDDWNWRDIPETEYKQKERENSLSTPKRFILDLAGKMEHYKADFTKKGDEANKDHWVILQYRHRGKSKSDPMQFKILRSGLFARYKEFCEEASFPVKNNIAFYDDFEAVLDVKAKITRIGGAKNGTNGQGYRIPWDEFVPLVTKNLKVAVTVDDIETSIEESCEESSDGLN